MALRVLLADESATIKKVIQLALQDYAVEVLSVNSGDEVLSICDRFKPDILFIDILLQKKNGYEVAAEVMAHPTWKSTPIVLMWSGFVELDEDKFQACKATAQLEKPFDILTLRNLVQQLVPKTKTQTLSEFLDFPDTPSQENQSGQDSTYHQDQQKNDSTISSNNENNNFEAIQLPPLQNHSIDSNEDVHSVDNEILEDDDEDIDNQWQQKPLETFKVELNSLKSEPDVSPITQTSKHTDFTKTIQQDVSKRTFSTHDHDEKNIESELSQDVPIPESNTVTENTKLVTMTTEQIETLVRKEAQLLIEQIAWQIVPEIATNIVQKEINRLLQEQDDNSQISIG